ncbi:MAG: hypothetical protein FGM15_04435 [Chthoniobacterales bacterium]|nr:hypothetical protein [Chthoniobacterales bacterium]
MVPFPNPLHPAVVHFPIAFVLLGAGLAVLAVLLRRWNLPLMVAILLVCGAAGAVVATSTGEEEAERLHEISAAGEEVLEEHEDWGELTRNIAVVAALLAVAAAFAANKRVAGIVLSALTAAAALAAAYSVVQTGHYGGELVYRHGAGVRAAADGAPSETAVSPSSSHEEKKNEEHGD